MLGNAHRARGPWHVVRKDFEANVLYATRHYSADDKERNEFTADNINWLAGRPPESATQSEQPLRLRVKVRHGEHMYEDARVTLSDGGKAAHVDLGARDKGLAPGQFAAFYDGDECLGSGVISEGAI